MKKLPMAKDLQEKQYALVSEIKEGDFVTVDGGFNCMKEGTKKKVRRRNGVLNISCRSDGGHGLDGQEETVCGGVKCQPFYMGIYKC